MIFLCVGMFSLLIAPIQELAPVIASEHGDGAHVVGFLLGALAFGSVLGSLVVERRLREGRPRNYVWRMLRLRRSLHLAAAPARPPPTRPPDGA